MGFWRGVWGKKRHPRKKPKGGALFASFFSPRFLKSQKKSQHALKSFWGPESFGPPDWKKKKKKCFLPWNGPLRGNPFFKKKNNSQKGKRVPPPTSCDLKKRIGKINFAGVGGQGPICPQKKPGFGGPPGGTRAGVTTLKPLKFCQTKIFPGQPLQKKLPKKNWAPLRKGSPKKLKKTTFFPPSPGGILRELAGGQQKAYGPLNGRGGFGPKKTAFPQQKGPPLN